MIIQITINHHNLTLINVVNVEANTAFSNEVVKADLEIFQKTSNLVEPFLHMSRKTIVSVFRRFIPGFRNQSALCDFYL